MSSSENTSPISKVVAECYALFQSSSSALFRELLPLVSEQRRENFY
jgi:hypothetical protein